MGVYHSKQVIFPLSNSDSSLLGRSPLDWLELSPQLPPLKKILPCKVIKTTYISSSTHSINIFLVHAKHHCLISHVFSFQLHIPESIRLSLQQPTALQKCPLCCSASYSIRSRNENITPTNAPEIFHQETGNSKGSCRPRESSHSRLMREVFVGSADTAQRAG